MKELKKGRIYEGVVTASNSSEQTYTVAVDGGSITGCQVALGFMAGLMGIKTSMRLSVGGRVLFVYGTVSYIIGGVAGDPPDSRSHMGRSITDSGIKDLLAEVNPSTANKVPMHNMPQDLFDGELELGFLQAGFIRFMMQMVSVGGSERAQIQFHLLRDLTRIISGNFEHFSALGDEVIMDDGRVSMETNYTHYPHERMGLAKDGDPLEQKAKNFDGDAFDPKITGRWRYTKYLGFLGDVFNEWFTDPAEAAGRMAEDNLRSGKSRVHHGAEGEYLVQSCSEIAFERVVRIPVPIRLKHPDDPEGVLRKEFANLEKAYLKTWDQKKGEEGHHALFYLRDYARWLSQYHSLARIHQLAAKGGEFHVPSEADTPEPSPDSGEEDRKSANAGVTFWRDGYSTIRLMRDGSSLILDAFHNTWSTGPYGIMVDTPMHFRLSAAGDVSILAGGSFFLRARRHVELVSDLGGMILKSRCFFRALAERGTAFLQSNFDPADPYTPEEGDPEPEADENGFGVVITAPSSGMFVEAGDGFKLVQKGDSESVMHIDNRGKTKLTAAGDAAVTLQGVARLTLTKTLFLEGAGRILSSLSKVIFRGAAAFGIGRVKLAAVEAANVTSRGFIGPSKYVAERDDIEAPDLSFPDDAEDLPEVDKVDDPTIKWGFLKKKEYLNSKRPEWTGANGDYPGDSDQLFEGLSQQHLRLGADAAYDGWSFETLLDGDRIDSSKSSPFPGDGAEWLTATPTEVPLNEPSATAPSTMAGLNSSSLSSAALTFKFLKK